MCNSTLPGIPWSVLATCSISSNGAVCSMYNEPGWHCFMISTIAYCMTASSIQAVQSCPAWYCLAAYAAVPSSACSLHNVQACCLLQQAQAGLMSGLNTQQRREMYTKISDDSLAGLLVVMRFPERLKMLREVEQVDQALVDRVLRHIRYTLLLLHWGTKGPHQNGHASCPWVYAAVMPVTSHKYLCLPKTAHCLFGRNIEHCWACSMQGHACSR